MRSEPFSLKKKPQHGLDIVLRLSLDTMEDNFLGTVSALLKRYSTAIHFLAAVEKSTNHRRQQLPTQQTCWGLSWWLEAGHQNPIFLAVLGRSSWPPCCLELSISKNFMWTAEKVTTDKVVKIRRQGKEYETVRKAYNKQCPTVTVTCKMWSLCCDRFVGGWITDKILENSALLFFDIPRHLFFRHFSAFYTIVGVYRHLNWSGILFMDLLFIAKSRKNLLCDKWDVVGWNIQVPCRQSAS